MSDSQVLMDDVGLAAQLVRIAKPHDASLHDYDMRVGKQKQPTDIRIRGGGKGSVDLDVHAAAVNSHGVAANRLGDRLTSRLAAAHVEFALVQRAFDFVAV